MHVVVLEEWDVLVDVECCSIIEIKFGHAKPANGK
jgi:hypothetical protein